jgi:hypothetical protein
MSNITVTSTKRVIQVGRQIRIIKPTARANLKTIGVQGRPGRDGLDGIGSVFEFDQPTPSSSWIINHNRGVLPAFVAVIDGGGSAVNCGVVHPSVNQTVLSFNPPMSGKARLL